MPTTCFNECEQQPPSAAHDVPIPSGAADDAAPDQRGYEEQPPTQRGREQYQQYVHITTPSDQKHRTDIQAALHWGQMLDGVIDEVERLAKSGGSTAQTAFRVLETLELIRRWIVSGSPLAEGSALPALWELVDNASTDPKLPEALRHMERQLRERTAVRAHYYVCHALVSGSASDARDEFICFFTMQLGCAYTDQVHSRMMQAYHKAFGPTALFASNSQVMQSRVGHKRPARKPRATREAEAAQNGAGNATSVLWPVTEQPSCSVTQESHFEGKNKSAARLLPAYIGYTDEADNDLEHSENKPMLPYPAANNDWPRSYYATPAHRVKPATSLLPEYILVAPKNFTPDQENKSLRRFTEIAELDFVKVD